MGTVIVIIAWPTYFAWVGLDSLKVLTTAVLTFSHIRYWLFELGTEMKPPVNAQCCGQYLQLSGCFSHSAV